MAEPDVEEDIFADLYDDNDVQAPQVEPAVPEKEAESEPVPAQTVPEPSISAPPQPAEGFVPDGAGDGSSFSQRDSMHGVQGNGADEDESERRIGMKEDGKMFIGGLNWETTDQSLKDYFSQFGEVVECTVMRDGATGRSRGFAFLTFRDPKCVNTVVVKEHMLDGKLIDPKRAIPRAEQEKTAKIFVGGVSQDCAESEFNEFFMQFGRVLDATLMMDKNTGKNRGYGFVTYENDAAVDRTLEGPLSIHGKMIEVKRALPRGALRGDDDAPGKFSRPNQGAGAGGYGGNFNQQGGAGDGGQGGPNNMSPAMMAQYWSRMQQYLMMMQQNMARNAMNPQMMGAQGGMNPQMMQQMAQMQQMQQQGGGPGFPQGMGGGNEGDMGAAGQGGYANQEQLMFEQQKYERQQQARMQQGNFQGGNTWDGMYDDVPAPAHVRGNFNGGARGGPARGGGGAAAGPGRSPVPTGPSNAPANAPTGPKNAGIPGSNYRGGGRGGRRGFHPYARGGG